MDWIIASAGVRQGRPAPEERSHERPLAWKVVWRAAATATAVSAAAAAVEAAAAVAAAAATVERAAAALWHHVDWLKKTCRGL